MTNSPKQEYPSPTIVVGMGRFGLAVLERLGEDWEGLEQATEDASLKNLRLMHVRADEDVDARDWRENERQSVEIARYTGDGDLPTLALEFVILRSLGLIRYRNGTYQVAVPRDDGVVEVPTERAERAEPDFARLRYFDWLNLSPDPVSSVERLRSLSAREADLDLFITPLVHRVRQGHSPRAVLACISRCRALAEGRDPWPWGWLFRPLVERGANKEQETGQRITFQRDWLAQRDVDGLLDGLASEPIAGWKEWLADKRLRADGVDVDSVDLPPTDFDLCLPEPFLPKASDLASPIAPFELLKVDWETTGWATRKVGASQNVEFSPVGSSEFRLGLFDHDGSSRLHETHAEAFEERLSELAVHAHRGLVRMWVDLQRERVESSDEDAGHARSRDNADGSLDQSLEVLGELLVRPLVAERADLEDDELADDQLADGHLEPPEPLPSKNADGPELDERASKPLREIVVEAPPAENATRQALDERLSALGFAPPQGAQPNRLLFSEVALCPSDVDGGSGETTVADPDELERRNHGLLDLRESLNEQTRQLFDFSFLKEYRNKPVKRGPRLTIYVVCDATEAFSRASVKTVLREIHAELLRAFGPIFETFREGFDRALSVVPIIWMPHPADSFGGRHPLANRCEEAAIIESVQGVRRWIESVPRKKRCVPQVFINSRVTDNAVLSVWDSIRQTRDFLNFQTRNDLAGDAWLRRTAIGTRGDDFFASFSCHEIEFPAERAREYLANRYARHSIRRLEVGDHGALPEIKDAPIAAPEVDDLVAEPSERLAADCEQAAQRTSSKVRNRLEVSAATSVDQVEDSFDEGFEKQLLEDIDRQWHNFTRRRGEMDDMVDALRRDTSAELTDTLEVVQEAGDELIEEHASKGGLKRALAGFGELHALARDGLREREAARKEKERLCLEHRIPKTDSVGATREQVLEAGRQKPDGQAMNVGILMWALMAPAMGAPIAWAVAKALELHLSPGVFEFILGPLGPLVGALVVFLPAFWLLRRHMQKHVELLEEAIENMADAVARVVDGGSAALRGAPSIRSFMEARLVHTAGLATRSFARQVYARVFRDMELAGRLRRSIDLQRDVLQRRAEDLGVRVKMSELDSSAGEDDVSWLFKTRSRAGIDKLIEPDHLVDYYERRIGGDTAVDGMLERFIEEVGGFEQWRKIASLSDTDRILRFSRTQFDELVDEPVSDQFVFEDEVRQRLMDFVLTHFSNIGFGAKFSGYEGLDPDGMDLLAETALVMHPGLASVFEQARTAVDTPARLETLDVKEADLDPNAAYILSMVQGIRPHSVRNLRRFESFHHRAQMPDDRAFPLSGEWQSGGKSPRHKASSPINHLTGYDSLRESINRGVFDVAKRIEAKAAAELSDELIDETGGLDE